MKIVLCFVGLALLAGCAQVDETTGTTFAERCKLYRGAHAAAVINLERAERDGEADSVIRGLRISVDNLGVLVAACP